MSFALENHWVWDHWILRSEDQLDLFYLHAPKSLGNPSLRHVNAAIGHAVSKDNGKHWEVLPVAVAPRETPDFDDRAIWTGSAIHLPNGGIRLFYTAISQGDGGKLVQRIGWADSEDGVTFTRKRSFHDPKNPPLQAVAPWYETQESTDGDVAWRDPFVFQEDGTWHMIVTATLAREKGEQQVGAIGHLTSADLETWEAHPPIAHHSRFEEMECAQTRLIDGKNWLVFSCTPMRQNPPTAGFTWIVPGDGPLGSFDFSRAMYLKKTDIYAYQIFEDVEGKWKITGFHSGDDATFTGTIPDPLDWSLDEFELLNLNE